MLAQKKTKLHELLPIFQQCHINILKTEVETNVGLKVPTSSVSIRHRCAALGQRIGLAS